MVQFLRIISVLNIILAIGCFAVWRSIEIAGFACLAISVCLFFLNVWQINKFKDEVNAIVSNLIFNTISIAIILWIWI
jgi:hypothetical protein